MNTRKIVFIIDVLVVGKASCNYNQKQPYEENPRLGDRHAKNNKMKKATIFLILLFPFFLSFAQNEGGENGGFFFSTAYDSLGVCYGKCLVQAEWEIKKEERIQTNFLNEEITSIVYEYDTVFLDSVFVLNDENNFGLVSHIADTVVMKILMEKTKKEYYTWARRGQFARYESVMEQYEAYHNELEWIVENENWKSNNWKLNPSKSMYGMRTRVVLAGGTNCYGGEDHIQIPPIYRKIKILQPKKDISTTEFSRIKSLSKNYIIHRKTVKKYDIIKIPKSYVMKNTSVQLLKPAQIIYTKIHCSPTKTFISQLQKQLYDLGFYSGDFLGELTNKTKEAIIKYQMKNNLPIGQLDEGTITRLLAEKTPFRH
jgi:hypothetical protein